MCAPVSPSGPNPLNSDPSAPYKPIPPRAPGTPYNPAPYPVPPASTGTPYPGSPDYSGSGVMTKGGGAYSDPSATPDPGKAPSVGHASPGNPVGREPGVPPYARPASSPSPDDGMAHLRGAGWTEEQIQARLAAGNDPNLVSFEDIYRRDGYMPPDPSRPVVPRAPNTPGLPQAPQPPYRPPPPVYDPTPPPPGHTDPGVPGQIVPPRLDPIYMGPDGVPTHQPPPVAPKINPISMGPDGVPGHYPLPSTPKSYSTEPSGATPTGGVFRVDPEYAPGNAANNVTNALMRRYKRDGWY